MEEENAIFEDVCQELERTLSLSGSALALSRYSEANIASVYGLNASPLHRAKYGLEHMEELAYTAAEHHPYYRLLNGIVDAARIVLDRWDGVMDADDKDALYWSVSSLADALKRLKPAD